MDNYLNMYVNAVYKCTPLTHIFWGMSVAGVLFFTIHAETQQFTQSGLFLANYKL